MAPISRAALLALAALKFPGGNRATAQDLNDFIAAFVESVANLYDELEQNSGYAGIDANGKISVSRVSVVAPTNTKFLRDDGVFAEPFDHDTRVFDGDGVTTVFNLPHALAAVPSEAVLTAKSADASRDHYTSNLSPTHIQVTFLIAPAPGSGNVVLSYIAVP